MGAGWILTQYLWNSYQRASLMDSWVQTPCQIISSEIDDTQLNQKGFPKYSLEVTYQYEYEGKKFTGDQIKRLPTEASDLKKVQKKQKSWPEGTESVCWVNPDEPNSAVLKKDTKAALYSIWFPKPFFWILPFHMSKPIEGSILSHI